LFLTRLDTQQHQVTGQVKKNKRILPTAYRRPSLKPPPEIHGNLPPRDRITIALSKKSGFKLSGQFYYFSDSVEIQFIACCFLKKMNKGIVAYIIHHAFRIIKSHFYR
jgi:hypothetical protein